MSNQNGRLGPVQNTVGPGSARDIIQRSDSGPLKIRLHDQVLIINWPFDQVLMMFD